MRYALKNPPTVDAAEVRHLLDAAKLSLGNLPAWAKTLYDQGRIEFDTESIFVHLGTPVSEGPNVREAGLGDMVVLDDSGQLYVMSISLFDTLYEIIEEN